ncbi:MAG: hypothetical protein GX815_10185 [Clostridiales bacterium]|nr:hypothetical protein [Clostridiales bacterium]
MFYILGRTQKVLDELMHQMFSSTNIINSFKMKEGNFLGPGDVDADSSNWQCYTTGSQWGGRDAHAWFRATIQVPEYL